MSGGIFVPQGSLMLGFAGAETPVVQLQSPVATAAAITSPVADSSVAPGPQGPLVASVSPTVSDSGTSAVVTLGSDAGASTASLAVTVPSTTVLTGAPATSSGASYALIVSGGSNVQPSGLNTEQPQIVSGTNDATGSNSTSDVNQPDNSTAVAIGSSATAITDGWPAAIQTIDLAAGVNN